MSKFTNKQIFEIYNTMGVSDPKFFNEKKIVNLFKLLNIEPQFDDAGKRILTPYEILGVLPQIVDNKEKPIVFAIKHKVSKIGRYEGQIKDFFYKKQKVKEEKTVLQTLKERYRAAIFAGDDALADNCLSMIGQLSSDELREFKDSFYDYSKFYKRMKKQLLIDLFSHFFLLYIQNMSKIIKSGIIKKKKAFKPYREKVNESADVTFNSEMDIINMKVPQVDPIQFGLQNIKKVVINDKDSENLAVLDISDKEIKIKANQTFSNSENTISETIERSDIEKDDLAKDTKPVQDKIKPEIRFEDLDLFLQERPSFIKKRKKIFHRLGLDSPYAEETQSEEKAPYSKKEKSNKEREIEI